MKRPVKFIFLFFVILSLSDCTQVQKIKNDRINTVIGDESFENTFGTLPDAKTDDHLRIQTHLLYAEKLLRDKDVSSLSPAMKRKREFLLDALHEYALAGNFPHNYDHPESRKPCFIDRDGNICAVGYLVQENAGYDLAEKINEEHQYDLISEMNDPAVDAWIAQSGLTKEECEIIQPTYEWDYQNEVQVSAGASYRLENRLYYMMDISMQTYYKHNENFFSGIGIRYDHFKKHDFEAGLRLFGELGRWKNELLVPQLAFSFIGFQYNDAVGMNLKPEVGLVIGTYSRFNLHVSYGYEVSVVAVKKYGAGRNDLSASLAYEIRNLPEKKSKRQVW